MTTTTHDRVLEAVAKSMAIVAQIHEGEQAVAELTSKRSDAIKANNVDDLLEERATDMVTATETSEAVYQAVIKKAHRPLVKAEVIYEGKRVAAQEVRDKEIDDVQAGWDQKIAITAEEREMATATAQAEAHTAKQEVTLLKEQLKKYQQQVKQQLGIDLDSLLTVAQG